MSHFQPKYLHLIITRLGFMIIKLYVYGLETFQPSCNNLAVEWLQLILLLRPEKI